MAFWGLPAAVVAVVITDNLLVFDPKDEDAELLKQPSTLPTEVDDNAGDGGGVPTFPNNTHRRNNGDDVLVRNENFPFRDERTLHTEFVEQRKIVILCRL